MREAATAEAWRGVPALALSATLAAAVTLALAAPTARAADAGPWLPAGAAPRLGQPLLANPGPALVHPDGRGLPAGSGTAAQGAVVFEAQCASCHGRHGEGNTAPELVGGEGPLSSPEADKTLATYWPYASTLFDTVQRSMPPAAPGKLSADEIYALCAWMLARNGLWPEDRPLDAAGLASVRMPNREGFVSGWSP